MRAEGGDASSAGGETGIGAGGIGAGAGGEQGEAPGLCDDLEPPVAEDVPIAMRCPECCSTSTCESFVSCGACDGAVLVFPDRELLEEDVDSFMFRITDEAGHIRQKLGDPELDFFVTLDAQSGLYARTEEGGFEVFRMASMEGGLGCARALMRRYTGGHGGFGHSALDGTMDVLVTGDPAGVLRIEIQGRFGMVEDGALLGVPIVPVHVIWEFDAAAGSTELVAGSLGDIRLPLR